MTHLAAFCASRVAFCRPPLGFRYGIATCWGTERGTDYGIAGVPPADVRRCRDADRGQTSTRARRGLAASPLVFSELGPRFRDSVSSSALLAVRDMLVRNCCNAIAPSMLLVLHRHSTLPCLRRRGGGQHTRVMYVVAPPA